jgi:hypothetical protein
MSHFCRFHFQHTTAEAHKCGPSYNPGEILPRLQDDDTYASTQVEEGASPEYVEVLGLEQLSQNRPTFHI